MPLTAGGLARNVYRPYFCASPHMPTPPEVNGCPPVALRSIARRSSPPDTETSSGRQALPAGTYAPPYFPHFAPSAVPVKSSEYASFQPGSAAPPPPASPPSSRPPPPPAPSPAHRPAPAPRTAAAATSATRLMRREGTRPARVTSPTP